VDRVGLIASRWRRVLGDSGTQAFKKGREAWMGATPADRPLHTLPNPGHCPLSASPKLAQTHSPVIRSSSALHRLPSRGAGSPTSGLSHKCLVVYATFPSNSTGFMSALLRQSQPIIPSSLLGPDAPSTKARAGAENRAKAAGRARTIAAILTICYYYCSSGVAMPIHARGELETVCLRAHRQMFGGFRTHHSKLHPKRRDD
jgi:hypothetical protein